MRSLLATIALLIVAGAGRAYAALEGGPRGRPGRLLWHQVKASVCPLNLTCVNSCRRQDGDIGATEASQVPLSYRASIKSTRYRRDADEAEQRRDG
jgi:hypothetical protein